MYQIKPILTKQDIDLPSCMYKIKPVVESLHSDSSSSAGKSVKILVKTKFQCKKNFIRKIFTVGNHRVVTPGREAESHFEEVGRAATNSAVNASRMSSSASAKTIVPVKQSISQESKSHLAQPLPAQRGRHQCSSIEYSLQHIRTEDIVEEFREHRSGLLHAFERQRV